MDHAAAAQSADCLSVAVQRSSTGTLDATFVALSDATRREMIHSLLHRPRRAGELADIVAMSPQALSRHLRVLRKAGLVVEEGIDADARVRVYSVHPGAFAPLQEWLADVEDVWSRQLQAFKAYAENTHRTRKPRT